MTGIHQTKKPRLPPLNALRAFEAAARHQSFVAAAEELGVTAAAISRHIKGLEELMGLTLFNRHPQSLNLTGCGRAWLPHLSDAFNILESSTARARRQTAPISLAITAHMAFATGWLLPRLDHFRNEFPDVELELFTHTETPEFGQERKWAGAIMSGTGEWPGLEAHFIFSRGLIPVCSPSYLRSRPNVREPSDLLSEKLIFADASAGEWLEWFASIGIKNLDLGSHMRFPTGFLPVQAAMNGLGFALADRSLIDSDLEMGRLVVPFDMPVYIRNTAWYFVYPPGQDFEPTLRQWAAWLQREAGTTAK